MLPVTALDYDLPADLIAVRPVEPRDASRLMVVSRSDESRIEHLRFTELPGLLRAGDLLVFNRSAVLPARLLGRRADTSGKVGGLYLASTEDGLWRVMLHAGGRLREGTIIVLARPDGTDSDAALRIREKSDETYLVEPVSWPGATPSIRTAEELLTAVGATPLPPYILNARRDAGLTIEDERDRRWYQTVYADESARGSVAAPTAGLHFTREVLERVERAGVKHADVVLHVGAGTFRPVQSEYVEQHQIHAEWCHMPTETIRLLESARATAARIIPVGTTSLRVLESLPSRPGPDLRTGGFTGETRLLITPGHAFRWTDGLITNFHLPRSTLMALVAALFPGGAARLIDLYRTAVRERYRFYSYGDAMLILP